MGRVTKTSNANTSSYYSYRYDGSVDWIIVDYGLPLGAKSIDYDYDAGGRVKTVMYQKDSPYERFDHEYAYDPDGRLSSVHTIAYDSQGQEQDRQLQARYEYYKHGPLKRVELGEGLQGIDYVYTINGWLKSINNPDMANDPGSDSPSNNGFYADVFGMTLEYYGGDYTRTGSNILSYVTSDPEYDNYNGNISSEAWRTVEQGPNVKLHGVLRGL